jgi:hypothetical protein
MPIASKNSAIGTSGPQSAVYDVQFAGSAIADSETGSASGEADQTNVELRRPDHRRSGLRAAESRGDGSVVQTSGGTLRARECPADEQPCLRQMAPDLQG